MENNLWIEKYRPSILDDYICSDEQKLFISQIIETQEIPNLIFYGNAGTGKTSLSKILIKHIDCDNLYINASDQRGIDIVRELIINFCEHKSIHKYKIILLDEGDQLTSAAQAALKEIIEKYSNYVRFIFTTNNIGKIINPIQSRCQVFEIKPTDKNKNNIYIKLIKILKNENIKYNKEDIINIITKNYPDIRKCINTLQQNSINNELSYDKNIDKNTTDKIIEKIKENDFEGIREIIYSETTESLILLYEDITNRYLEFTDDPTIFIYSSQYMWQHISVINKHINFLAFINSILKLNKK